MALQQCVHRNQLCNVEDADPPSCPGVNDDGVCALVAGLTSWRAKSYDDQLADYTAIDDAIVAQQQTNPGDPHQPTHTTNLAPPTTMMWTPHPWDRHSTKTNSQKQIVVSRFREDLHWANDCPYPVTVYNKGPAIDYLNDNVSLIHLPNIGREGHTMIHHIIRNYTNLPETTIFLQGKPHSGNELHGRLGLQYHDTTGLTKEYLPNFPEPWVKAHDRIQHQGPYEVRYGDARFIGGRQYERNKDWLMMVWHAWFDCMMPSAGEWFYIYGAELATPRHRVLARPLAFWQLAYQRVSKATTNPKKWDTDPYSSWALEALWYFILGDHDRYPVKMLATPKKGCGCGDGRPRLKR